MTPEDALTIAHVRLLAIAARFAAGGELTRRDVLRVAGPLLAQADAARAGSLPAAAPGPGPGRRRVAGGKLL